MLKIKLKLFLTALFCFLVTSITVAQSENQAAPKFFGSAPIDFSKITRNYVVSFKEDFTMNFDESTLWSILEMKSKKTILQGEGKLEYVFGQPGEYFISTHVKQQDSDECSKHEHLNYSIKVTENHMHFDFSSVSLSQDFRGGSQQTYQLLVTVIFENYSNESEAFQGFVEGVGLGVDLSGTTNSEVQLKNGLNQLTYSISGVCKKGGYLTLDFKDINGNIQSYYLTEQID